MASPRSPASKNHLRLIEQAMAEAENVAVKQQILLSNEKARQEAEENLKHLTQKVDSGVEEVSNMIENMSVNAAEQRNLLRTRAKTPTRSSPANSPPATPTRQQAVVTSPPVTPTSRPALASPSPSRPPRGTTLLQSGSSDPVYAGSKYPAYVVYQGKGGTHGVFYAWSTHKDVQGARYYYNHGMHHHVVRSFSSRALADSFYEEFCASGIPELLAEQEPSDDECFIVVEGVKPMACATRKALIMEALQFRGGVAYRFIGDLGGAWAQFNQFKEDGLVKQIHAPRTSF